MQISKLMLSYTQPNLMKKDISAKFVSEMFDSLQLVRFY